MKQTLYLVARIVVLLCCLGIITVMAEDAGRTISFQVAIFQTRHFFLKPDPTYTTPTPEQEDFYRKCPLNRTVHDAICWEAVQESLAPILPVIWPASVFLFCFGLAGQILMSFIQETKAYEQAEH